jgi:gliding motility-associated-like protein
VNKKKVLTIFLFCLCLSAKAQFSVSSTSQYLQLANVTNVDAVFLFNGIDPLTEITYTGGGTTEWRLYDGSFYSNQASVSPDDATGYIVRVNGTNAYWIWVIDCSLYPVVYDNLQVSYNQPNPCENLILEASLTVPDLVYYDKNNVRRILPRTFTLKYTDYEFASESWQDKPVSNTYEYPFSPVTLPAPKKDVTFTLSGDNYAAEMGLAADSIQVDYLAVAVAVHPKGTIEERAGMNEYERSDESQTVLKGSGPLVISFESRANVPVAAFFEWIVYDEATPQSYYRYNDENLRYTFKKTGDYIAKLTAKSAGGCEAIDSLRINVTESLLEVPNAFSPNGDGMNDEFRVVFRSIATFNIAVYNRWGKVVYKGTDPSKGWNGRINGKEAAAGGYYYLIEAVGTDGTKYHRRGHVALFR